jgi:hypothetical protein
MEENTTEPVDNQMQKARKAILEIIAANGGVMSMGEAHDFCEGNFGVGHRRFSDLMEYCVGKEYFTYDRDDNLITLSENGRNAL